MRDKDLDDGALDDKSWKTKHSSINQESVKVLSSMVMLLIHHGFCFFLSPCWLLPGLLPRRTVASL
jgi:hypothetical protein